MARSEKNLTAVFTDTANAIRSKTGTTETICPLDFADKINSIETGGGGMKAYFEAGGKCGYSTTTTFDGIINYSDTENLTDCHSLFFSSSIISIPMLNTSNVTNMNYMFQSCVNLKTIPLLDTSKVTSMASMFKSCSSLTSIPELDTSNVTNMEGIFESCSSLTTIPSLNTSKVNVMASMFGYCTKLKSIPQLDTSNVQDMIGMFYNCVELTSIPQMSTPRLVYARNMFYSCSKLKSVPNIDTSNVKDMSGMFSYCYELTSIPELDASNVTDFNWAFNSCTSLTEFHMKHIKVSLNISDSTLLPREALLEIFGNLSRVNSTQELRIGSTNLAKLTDEDKAIATNKGWTLA